MSTIEYTHVLNSRIIDVVLQIPCSDYIKQV